MNHLRSPRAALLVALGLCSACTPETKEPPAPICGQTEEVDLSDLPLVGSFRVELAEPVAPDPGKTTIVGRVSDGPTPAQIIWEPGTKQGACTIYTPRVPFCSTPCGGSAACVEDDTCQDYPSAGSVGTVTISGLMSEDGRDTLSIDPVADTYQVPVGVTLRYPAFEEGGEVCLEAAGDVFAGFTLGARGIGELALTSEAIALVEGQPVALTWEAAADPDLSTIRVKLDISHHGGSKGKIECEGADTGSLEIAGPLVTELLGLGVAGFPSIIVTRESSGAAAIDEGRVELVLVSSVERSVEIEGLNSCTETTDCPMGQTCQPDLTCK